MRTPSGIIVPYGTIPNVGIGTSPAAVLIRKEIQGDKSMSAKAIGYWATTIFVAVELLAGGLTDLVHGREALVAGQPVIAVVTHLGYPVYVLTILGGWKLLG